MISKEKFAKFLKEMRLRKKCTLQELANNIGVSKGAISQWENAISLPSMDSLYKLAEFFNIDALELIRTTMEDTQNTNTENIVSTTTPEPILEDNTITLFGRGTGMKKYKVSPKQLKVIRAILDDDDGSDDIDF